jgi:hypothetical protein
LPLGIHDRQIVVEIRVDAVSFRRECGSAKVSVESHADPPVATLSRITVGVVCALVSQVISSVASAKDSGADEVICVTRPNGNVCLYRKIRKGRLKAYHCNIDVRAAASGVLVCVGMDDNVRDIACFILVTHGIVRRVLSTLEAVTRGEYPIVVNGGAGTTV